MSVSNENRQYYSMYITRASHLPSKGSVKNRPINSRFVYVINMADFWGSLALLSIGDTHIFPFNSQINGKS